MFKRYPWYLFGLMVITSPTFAQSTDTAALLPPIQLLLDDQADGPVRAIIKPSRTECASPCTVVFSAEDTTADGLNDHGIWSQLSYYWDFDTDETDTFGALYNQTYTYVSGDTSHEKGHVPMVTKTFLCATGTCTYNVGMRAQNAAGEFDDAFVTITVNSESVAWNTANTICVSNTLDVNANWTGFDKPCPAGASKQNAMPNGDQYNGKLVLIKRGDVFNGRGLATLPNQSNFKIGVFGNTAENRPDLNAPVVLGVTRFTEGFTSPNSANYLFLTDALIQQYGWPENIYIEGIKVASVTFPMSYQHVGLHDVDIDREADDKGGFIAVSSGVTRCVGNSSFSCANVPFPKGGYISSVDIVGARRNSADFNTDPDLLIYPPGLNIAEVTCSLVNYLGIVDTSVRKSLEHNIRIAGWYRFNMMRSLIRGQHYQPGARKNHKLTLRSCVSNSLFPRVWADQPGLNPNWNRDIEGRTRADIEHQAGGYVHTSRYQVINSNQFGDGVDYSEITSNPQSNSGGIHYNTNARAVRELVVDIMLSNNTFVKEKPTDTSTFNILMESTYGTCVGNTYTVPDSVGCHDAPANQGASVGIRIEPTPVPAPGPPSG